MKPWELVSKKLVYDGYRKIERRTYRCDDDREIDIDVKLEGNTVCSLPITEDGHAVLAAQFRPGPGSILRELPGGGMNVGEEPLQAMRRELLEETGYEGDLVLVGSTWDCAYSTCRRYHFLATHCRKVTEPHTDEDEKIDVILMPVDEFRNHLATGDLTDTTTGLLALAALEKTSILL
ncbi:NUDIX hydrolase [Candidatus Uhrbacteria bacterium]|nr:NUDIX hydrolase [Candidatus Uhrbacteria bacterium]